MKVISSLSSLVALLFASQALATPLNFASGVTVGGKGAAAAPGNASTAKGASSAAPAGSSAAANSDPQKSLELDPKVIATGFANDGQDVPTAGQVASLTSTNNFINFCLTKPDLPITNGLQIKTGSCNPAPMGVIAATTNMPSSKFQFPKNGDTIKSNTAFTIKMAISHLDTGFFVNANENYFAAPQFTNAAGDISGHSHIVVELLNALDQTSPTDPTHFAYFKGLNGKAENGVLTADVTNGLPAGTYRLASINTAANHQPVLVAVAQHGSVDDMVYFTITDDGAPASSSVDVKGANPGAQSGGQGGSADQNQGNKQNQQQGNNNKGQQQGGNKNQNQRQRDGFKVKRNSLNRLL
ncbi:hypothetical protein BXZ70DRAFT_1007364 [Cristinia sonorae]|uniref:Uncharacterized protein n=1 Tax=Cristinia sonorae TaxID=1940300 RepID=A0A8K0XR88_9AGAR|nr:hypothetical protein BXZ70DRAFT_1007364 [Cristinia sonorae]